MRAFPTQPVINYITQENIYDLNETNGALEERFGSELVDVLPQAELFALQLCTKYLDKMMLAEATIPFFEF